MEEDIKTKQHYLRSEIIDQGYDPSDFNTYMCSIRQEENIDLDNWSLEEIKKVVEGYKESLINKENQEEEEKQEEEKEIENQLENDKKNLNNNIYNNQSINKDNKNELVSCKTINTLEIQVNKQENNAFADYEKVIPCQKLEKNELTYRNDLYIKISEPKKINPGFFSISYYQYSVKTYPLNYDVSRKVSDFSYLNQKLPLINPVIYIPSLPNFQYGLKDDSPKKILYIQNYMNLLIENKYLRSLPIVYDFLTLPQNDWNNKVKSKYNKLKQATGFDAMPNFEGKYVIRISKNDEMKATKIKNEINSKNEALHNLNTHLDELLAIMDKVSNCFKSVGLSFE